MRSSYLLDDTIPLQHYETALLWATRLPLLFGSSFCCSCLLLYHAFTMSRHAWRTFACSLAFAYGSYISHLPFIKRGTGRLRGTRCPAAATTLFVLWVAATRRSRNAFSAYRVA